MSISHTQLLDLDDLEGFRLLDTVSEYVHSSLIRVFLILRKDY
jgi:tRNA G10  N-methylase Trm11